MLSSKMIPKKNDGESLEEEQLLNQHTIASYDSIRDDYSQEDLHENQQYVQETTYAEELSYIARNSIPNCAGFLLQYCINAFPVFFVSHLGKEELAANALAMTTYYITGPSIFMGMATAIDTICSQSYGAKQYHLVGLYFQKNVVLSMILFVPLSILWINMDKVLRLFVHNNRIIELATIYFHIMFLEAPAFIFYENGKRFIQAQGIFNAVIYILSIVVPINLCLNYALILSDTFGIGYIGSPIASVISYWLMAILLGLYIRFVNGSKCWVKINRSDIFHDLGGLIRLNIYGAIMTLSETFAFQIITVMVAQFDVFQLAAQSVTATYSNYFFTIPFAVGVVGSMRIGNYIGSGNKRSAIMATRCLYSIAICLGFSNFSIIFFTRNYIARYFADGDLELGQIISNCLIIVAIFQMLDCGFNICSAAVLRAQGRQRIGGILSFVSYYVVGLILELYFGFYLKYKLFGFWCGLSLGLAFLSITQTFCIIKSDWDEIISGARLHHH
ncbi:hypothetical protein DASC09_058680 [Saccharomycopsis crataegensis]|uniref:MATE efflux family protein n=1 Tax=Saccharomycopsis crataegensis TaxID=43959 RepID=A0AAV5QUW4_9ASCO|nr:hypothetical protein DASC09_058680 [Saccharomycopsis crataegensis]